MTKIARSEAGCEDRIEPQAFVQSAQRIKESTGSIGARPKTAQRGKFSATPPVDALQTVAIGVPSLSEMYIES